MYTSSFPTQRLRFRCWSRKPYALFASLKVCVTIGCLRTGTAGHSLLKQKEGSHDVSVLAENPEINRKDSKPPTGIRLKGSEAPFLQITFSAPVVPTRIPSIENGFIDTGEVPPLIARGTSLFF